MDCVRVSTGEYRDLLPKGKYTNIETIKKLDECRNECVSDLNCTAWYYQSGDKSLFDKSNGKCWVSKSVFDNGEYEAKPKVYSGKIECKNFANYGYILMWLLISAAVLFVVWYFLNFVEPKRFNLHERLLFPNFYFKGAKE